MNHPACQIGNVNPAPEAHARGATPGQTTRGRALAVVLDRVHPAYEHRKSPAPCHVRKHKKLLINNYSQVVPLLRLPAACTQYSGSPAHCVWVAAAWLPPAHPEAGGDHTQSVMASCQRQYSKGGMSRARPAASKHLCMGAHVGGMRGHRRVYVAHVWAHTHTHNYTVMIMRTVPQLLRTGRLQHSRKPDHMYVCIYIYGSMHGRGRRICPVGDGCLVEGFIIMIIITIIL